MKTAPLLLVAGLLGALLLASGTACRPRAQRAAIDSATVEAVNRGIGLMGQYDYDGAVGAFAEALHAAPDVPDLQVNLAIARFNRGRKEDQDIEQATALLDAVLQEHPDHARAWYFKGIILQHQGEAETAVACFEKVVVQRPDDGVAWYLLGLCKQRINQDAEKELLRAIELRPYLVSAHYRLWQMLQAAGETERAAPYLEQFKKLREHALAETIELPQYNQMGELALVVPIGDAPSRPARVAPTYRAGRPREIFVRDTPPAPSSAPSSSFGGAALADTDRDGQLEIFWSAGLGSPEDDVFWLKGNLAEGPAVRAPAASGLVGIESALACAIGDYDNDEMPDLFIVSARTSELFRGAGDGTFVRTTDSLPDLAASGRARSALWLDADHDGDLDLFVCRAGAANQLFNNNSDGTFTDIATGTALAAPDDDSVMALPGDLDGDRDLDLVILRAGASARIFLNELAGNFRKASPGEVEIRGELGGVLQDFNADGALDLLVLGGEPAALTLFSGDGRGRFRASEAFANLMEKAPEPLRGFRFADLDLDGDLDIAAFGRDGHALLNDGAGGFTFHPRVWAASSGAEITGAELVDLTGDLVPDLLLFERGANDERVLMVPGVLAPASSAVAIAPTGVRSRDKRTRSPASGYGVSLTVRAGTHEQTRLCTGQGGGFNQSPLPLVFGLVDAPQADYVRLAWPDGVVQVERALVAGRVHAVAETQRKISSCPVLFTWNGSRFEFITDFAGVGGLGYLAAPGEYAYPQPVDHVKIEPDQLRIRDGRYEVRITEPMEESAYVDRLELVAIDHPVSWRVFPDERLTVTGPPPTRELLVIAEPLFPRRALNPAGVECTDELRHADRHYAFEPELDRRFIGFCRPHTLELDFAEQLASRPGGERVFLFINGYLEYPYSQTTYAASQARLGWEPIRIERQRPDGTWEIIVPDAGALGGMARTMTVDLTGLLDGPGCRLRLISNLEIYYDQIFLGVPVSSDRVTVHSLSIADAELRYAGFAREVSPDGRQPLIYDYQQTDPSAPFDTLRGAYTRYGPVRELLQEFDDLFVLVGSGDEIAATFDATRLPAIAAGMARSFVLVSHAYCKDMDRYTATPQTLEPMPYRGMKSYPYPDDERPPATDAQRRIRKRYETRIVE